ncbi:TonB-dependent receptor [Salinimicrobium sp. TIG7-5_MAKvit]|uniref:TonB-dependent receptor n=1 Tax=Salinimicrobium sp. TIG7-5_MAKvit TaxID=3121289 RepID=UPI003C6DB7B6
MKLTVLFLFLSLFGLQASISYSQKTVTLDLEGAKVYRLLDLIEKQSDFRFVYKIKDVDLEREVNLKVQEEEIPKVLDKVFKETSTEFKIFGKQIFLTSKKESSNALAAALIPLEQQTLTVSGTIKEAGTGMAIPGANIIEQGTNNGVMSDFDGNYKIEVAEDAILEVSFIGYKSQIIPVNGRSEIDIVLETETAELDEVVVVGYGTQKRSVVTGAISSVKAEDLESMPVNNVSDALQGRTSGVTIASGSGQPGSGATVRIRGITTLNNNDPLWIVDGVVVDQGGINYLNQNDIESIEVLKDAASQAIYGARAASGVIMITTKAGKAGKIAVNYNGYIGLSQPDNKLNLLNASQYAQLRNEARLNDGKEIIFENPEALGVGTDWQETIFNDSALRQNHEVSISGGNEISTFYLSFGFLDEEGIVASEISNYERHNIRINSTHHIAKWLVLGENLGYSRQKNIGLGNTNSEYGGPLSSAINLDPITPVIVTDPEVLNGYPYNNPNLSIITDANGNPYGVSSIVEESMANPLAYIQTRLGNYDYSDNIVGNVFLEAEPLEGLKFRSTLGARLSYWGGKYFSPHYFFNTSNNSSQTSFTRNTNQKLDYNIENTVSYTNAIDDKHFYTILVGQGAYRDNEAEGLSVTKYGIPAERFEDASLNFNVPNDRISAYGYENVPHFVSSLFARLNYNFEEKYLLSAIIRRDGSSRFGENNKYGYFPSASVGWVVSKEDFWGYDNPFQFLKVRGSYGVVGNDNIGDLTYLSTIGSGRNYAFGDQHSSYDVGYSPDAPANPDLKWEETSQLNIGFESRFLEKFSFEFDWFKKKTSDILQYPRIPAFVGVIGNPARNIGDMENYGLEFNLGYANNLNENFGFSVNANASYLKNEVTNLGEGIEYLDGGESFQASSYPITRTAVGQAVNSFFGFKTNGIFQNEEEVQNYTNSEGKVIQPNAVPGDFKWQDTNGDGMISEEDRVFIGDPTPDWSYGLTISAYYKSFDLTIFGQGVAGNQIFQGLRRLDIANANYQEEALARWTGEGSTNSYPRMSDSDKNKNFSNPSDFYLQDGDYFRIKTLQIGYSLPEATISQVGLQKARIYVMSENLVTITGYTGFDPEIGGGVLSIDRGIYPQARSFMLGASLKF